jgi:hypothetical protein
VPLPDIPGGHDNITMENFDGVVQALEKLAEFGNWDHTSEPPDLPAGYADAPSLSNAAATPACGIELTEILHNKALPRKSQQKRICSNRIPRKLGVRTPEYDELSQKVLKGLLQNNRLYGPVTRVRSRPTGSGSTYEAGGLPLR